MARQASDFSDDSAIDRMVKALEGFIDTQVSKNWSDSNSLSYKETITVHIFHYFEQQETIQPEVSRRLKSLYEEAGWKVELVEVKTKTLFGLGAYEYNLYLKI